MPNPSDPPRDAGSGADLEPTRAPRPVAPPDRRGRGLVPLALATAVALVLGGATVARAVATAPLDAHVDLEFSLDGVTWTDAPDLVLGSWGCDVAATPASPAAPALPAAQETPGGAPEVDPCSMSPGESIDRTYHVRNATSSGRTGRYEVGVGDFVVSDHAEFDVTSSITGPAAVDSRTVTLYGADTPGAGGTPPPGSTVAALDLAPGQSAEVVDRVAVPRDAANRAQRQSVSPMIWVSFSDVGVVDSDGDGLPDEVEEQLGTDPRDATNALPAATVGQSYGPERFLPVSPPGTELVVDTGSLPPGVRLVDGVLTGTPTRPGTWDVGFTVTMPDGSSYSSTRRLVVHPGSGGGSSDLPDFLWPVVVVGLIGLIGALFGPGLGSLAGSLDEASGSGSAPAPVPTPAPGDPDSDEAVPGDATPADADPDLPGEVALDAVTPHTGAPSEEWARANSQVRGPLADTGVAAADLLLWALTAAAAGTVLILASRRRRDDAPD